MTANPNATPEAKAVLAWLASLTDRPDERVVSGQFVDHGQHAGYGYDERIAKLQQATGKWAAMAGFDYCDVWSQQSGPWSDPSHTNAVASAYWDSGGLVLMHHHFLNPWTNESPWKFETVGDIADLVDEQTEVHDAWMANVDKLAAGLAVLRDAGVVVLFSPFNEMNGGWFWWGHGSHDYESWVSQEDFVNLWRYLFGYLTDAKNLNNLLWLYCPTAQWSTAWKAVDYYYPGDAYVDIAAMTYYSDSLDDVNINGSYDKSVALGKSFGIGGMGPDSEDGTYDYGAFIDKIKADHPEISFFLAWHQQWAIVENQGATDLMNDPWIITRDEVDWRSEMEEDVRSVEDVITELNAALPVLVDDVGAAQAAMTEMEGRIAALQPQLAVVSALLAELGDLLTG
jgi:mannan endo-1,4-beta-mannosidase